MNLVVISLIILAVFFVAVGIVHRVPPSAEVLQTRSFSISYIAAALFTVIGSGEYALSVSNIKAYGWAGLSFLVGLALSFLLIRAALSRIFLIRERAETKYIIDGYTNYTTPDFIHTLYGKIPSIIASAIVVICFFGLYVLQIYVGSILLIAATGMGTLLASSLIALTVIAYACFGGFRSLFRTDLAQAILMYAALLITVFGSIYIHSDQLNYWESISTLNSHGIAALSLRSLAEDATVVSVFLLTICAAFSGADLWQRVNVAESQIAARKALLQGAVAILTFTVLLYLLSVDAVALIIASGIQSTDPFVDYIKLATSGTGDIAAWPELLTAIFAVGLLSAFVSTADTSLLLCVTAMQNEAHRWFGVGAEPDSQSGALLLDRSFTILGILVIGLIGLGFSVYAPNNAVNQFLIILGLLAVLGVPVLASLYGFGNKGLVVFALSLGVIVTVYIGYIDTELNSGWGILLPAAPGLFCFLARRKEF